MWPFKRKIVDGIDPVIANKVLELAQDWGEDLLQPTQPRAAKLFPHLTPQQLDEYDTLARQAMHMGNSAADRKKFRWINSKNRSRMSTLALYYANK